MFHCFIFFRNEPVARFYGHDNKTFYVKAALSPDDNYLVSGSGDSKAYIWNVRRPELDPVKLKGWMMIYPSPRLFTLGTMNWRFCLINDWKD